MPRSDNKGQHAPVRRCQHSTTTQSNLLILPPLHSHNQTPFTPSPQPHPANRHHATQPARRRCAASLEWRRSHRQSRRMVCIIAIPTTPHRNQLTHTPAQARPQCTESLRHREAYPRDRWRRIHRVTPG